MRTGERPPARPLPSGRYPIERRSGEIERLRIQAAAIAFDAAVMLDRIGVGPGWRCLDLGCGAGGILNLLAERVGPAGLALGLDADPILLAAARQWAGGRAGTAFVASDAYHAALRPESFDLVHVRFVASTAGLVDDLLREALGLVRPGGVLAFQEPDTDTLRCHPPHPAWDRLKQAVQDAFAAVGGDTKLAQRLYGLLRRTGLEDVRYRPFLVGVTSGQPMTDYLPATVESVRGTLLDKGIIEATELDRALAECRAHLAQPDTIFTTYLTSQVWGRKPGAGLTTARPLTDRC
ncbi:MAG: methyltransferase domain-containing protein [Candidatus Rokuibacteriota bacterium]